MIKNRLSYSIITSLMFSFAINAQEISESDLGFNGNLLALGAQSCLDTFNEKLKIKREQQGKGYSKFNEGRNIRGGSMLFFSEGVASINAQPDDPLYIDAIQNAISLASLRAKKDLALFRSTEISRQLIDTSMEAVSSGISVADYGKQLEQSKEKDENYNSKNLAQKFIIFLHQKLDQEIEGKDELDMVQLEKELENVVSQNVMGEIITTLAYSEISGMKNIQIQVKKDEVCVLSVWTERTKRWADELGSLNYVALANLRPGKTTYESQIPSKKTPEGLAGLTAAYGLHVDVDINGEIYLISYAQAGAMDSSSNSINNARMIAENRARSQIASFQNEAVDVYQKLDSIQISTTYKDEMTNKFNERNFMSRTQSSSALNISGIAPYDWWAVMHPLTEKPVVGSILVWQPSNAMTIESNIESNEYDDLPF